MNRIEEKATKFAEERCGRLDYGTGQNAYRQGANETLEEVCNFLKETFYDDHSDASTGIACLFPDIILTDKYFTVDDLIDGLKKHIEGD